MDSRSSKLRERILVSSVAVLIFASAALADKPRCYWCGPLAEQVHRSQRAPSCNSFHLDPHETVCDPGYSHCATVATSPPYAESRLCVKFYQDECYSLYCNSTKTWRMVCACQGDLCNGPNTDRETQAFALVNKFAKTKSRNKRNLANFVNVKPKNVDDNTVIIMGKDTHDTELNQAEETKENMATSLTAVPKRDEDKFMIVHGSLTSVDTLTINIMNNDSTKTDNVDPTASNMNTGETTKTDANDESTIMEPVVKVDENTVITMSNEKQGEKSKENISSLVTPVPKKVEENFMIVHGSLTNIDKSHTGNAVNNDATKKYTPEPTASNFNNKPVESIKSDTNIGNTKPNTSVNDIKTDKTHNVQDQMHTTNNKELDKHHNTEMVKATATIVTTDSIKEKHDAITTTTSIRPTTIETSIEIQTVSTAVKMPPAEALQQNVTPTKAMEVTTTTTLATTENHNIEENVVTTVPSKPHNETKKNGSTQNSVILTHIIIVAFSVLVRYCG